MSSIAGVCGKCSPPTKQQHLLSSGKTRKLIHISTLVYKHVRMERRCGLLLYFIALFCFVLLLLLLLLLLIIVINYLTYLNTTVTTVKHLTSNKSIKLQCSLV